MDLLEAAFRHIEPSDGKTRILECQRRGLPLLIYKGRDVFIYKCTGRRVARSRSIADQASLLRLPADGSLTVSS